MNSSQYADFSYCLTSELDLKIKFKVIGLDGSIPTANSQAKDHPTTQRPDDDRTIDPPTNDSYFITCTPFADNKPLTLPFRTSLKPSLATGGSNAPTLSWNEWIELPILYNNLHLSTQLDFTVWDIDAPRKIIVVGGATFSLFGKNNTIRKGVHKLDLWPWTAADGSMLTTTPSKFPHDGNRDNLDMLHKLKRRFHRGDIVKNEFMDLLAFEEIAKLEKLHASSAKHLFLYIELPLFDFPLVYNEKVCIFPLY